MTGDSHKPKQPNKTSRFLLVHTRPFLACVGHGWSHLRINSYKRCSDFWTAKSQQLFITNVIQSAKLEVRLGLKNRQMCNLVGLHWILTHYHLYQASDQSEVFCLKWFWSRMEAHTRTYAHANTFLLRFSQFVGFPPPPLQGLGHFFQFCFVALTHVIPICDADWAFHKFDADWAFHKLSFGLKEMGRPCSINCTNTCYKNLTVSTCFNPLKHISWGHYPITH